jgi:hypothetical protein
MESILIQNITKHSINLSEFKSKNPVEILFILNIIDLIYR